MAVPLVDPQAGRFGLPAEGIARLLREAASVATVDVGPRLERAPVLDGIDFAALRDDVRTRLDAEGVRFGGDDGWPFVVDPVPRILDAPEWAALAAGLEQRVRALDAFVHDAYGERRIVAEGLMTDATIDATEGYEPLLRGVWPEHAPALGVSGLDVIRDTDGALLVLEDNLRTPSGLAYAVAARRAVASALPETFAQTPVADLAGPLVELLRAALMHAAPEGVEDPAIVVLTDGPSSVAHFEHEWLAEQLGVPLVTIADLERTRFGRLCRRGPDGHSYRIDVVYRRSDSDRVFAPEGGITVVAAALLEPWLAGRLGIVNGFGTGVADDKLTHARVEDMVRLYLGEEPLARSVPTLELDDPGALAMLLEDPRAFVVKHRHGEGGKGVTVGRDADDETLRALLDDVRAEPCEYIAQRMVSLSVHPTVVDDGVLEPRHVDLRPFIFSTADGPRAAPGGLTRVALQRGSLVVNSSQQGGAKDTWVLSG